MNSSRSLERLALAAILLLAYFMSSIPHWDYSYPVHVDEWWHYGDAQSLVQAGGMPYPDPFYGGVPIFRDKEVGFHLLLGSVKLTTGISWLNMFLSLPGVFFVLLALLAYAFGKKRGFGLGAAFLVALIPTSYRVLGPSFLVPVALGLTFIPLTLFTLHRLMCDLRGPLILFLITLSLLFIHPPTMAMVSAIALIHFVFFLLPGRGRDPRQARQSAIAFTLLIYIYVIMAFWAPTDLNSILKEAGDPAAHLDAPPIWDALPKFGYIPVSLAVIGAGILIYGGKRHDLALVTAAAGLLVFQHIYPLFYIGPDIMYERGWLYLYVLMALLGGVALRELCRWTTTALRHRPSMPSAAGYVLISILAVSAFTLSLRSHLSEEYYHVIDNAAYQDFVWISEYVPSHFYVAALDTSVAWAFGSLSGKVAYTAEAAPNFHPEGRLTMQFLSHGASDTSWLDERGISIVYIPFNISNNDLAKVHNNFYLLTR